ncbi:MAG: tetratricopeptide repeat protein [Solirubrobacterales bacterium]
MAALLVYLASFGFGTPSARAEAEPSTNCRRGQALKALGRLGLAEEAFLEDLKTQASVKCGREHLQEIAKAVGPCAVAEALGDSGQKEKAKEAYVKVLEEHPEAKCAKQSLGSSPEGSEHWWEWMATAAKDAVGVLGFLVVAAACIAFLLWLFLSFQMRGKNTRRRWPARVLLRPSLEVKAFDDTGVEKHMGPAVASLVRGRVKSRDRGGVDIVTGHTALSEALKPLSDISAEAGAAVAVVSFLLATLPRRNYGAAGALQAKGEHGRGISIELNNDNRQLSATTLWGNEFEAPDEDEKAFQRLSVPVAAWLDHRIATDLEKDDDLPTDAQSWALFKAGVAWHEDGEFEKARSLYETALTIDNVWAMANLGSIAMLDGDYPESFELLTEALTALEGN